MQIEVESVEFLNVPPGSVLVLRVPNYVSAQKMHDTRRLLLDKHLPNVVDVLVFPEGCELTVMAATT